MPKRVLIIGIFFCLVGVLAAYEIIDQALHARVYLNFAILMLPIGIGLLRGKEIAQWWARIWIILGYCFYVLTIGLVLSFPKGATVNLSFLQRKGPEAVPYVITATLIAAGLTYLCHRLLYSEKANAFFHRNEIDSFRKARATR